MSSLLREDGRSPVAYISGASFLSWIFICLPRKPSYSASFLHWIFLLSYPHSITAYIFDEYINSRWRHLPFKYPESAGAGFQQVAPETGISKVSPEPYSPCVEFLGWIGPHLGCCRAPFRIDRARGVGSVESVEELEKKRFLKRLTKKAWSFDS